MEELIKENIRLKEELIRKNEQILLLQRQLYGRRSEKRLPDYQNAGPSLFDCLTGDDVLEEEKTITQTIIDEICIKAQKRREQSKQKSPKVSRSYKLPSNLERVTETIYPEEAYVLSMEKIGEDVTERLMLEPSRFWVKRIVRPIYKVKGSATDIATTIVQAELPSTILPGCMVDSSVLSQIIVDKFLHHLPEYRQSSRFKGIGVEISTSSINRWVHSLADKLYLLYKLQVKDVLSSDYIQVDETTLPIADGKGKTRKSYLWVVKDMKKPGVFFHYDGGSRSQDVILKLLKDYQGAIQTDGYAAYSIYESKKGVLPLGCMAHVRRKFENALTTHPESQKALDYISVLYMLEANLKADNADAETIRDEREKKAYPILQQMERWMLSIIGKYPPKDPLHLAIQYAFGMWPRISRYCKDGNFQIDNNPIERCVRPVALGRKNYLFSGNDKGAEDNCLFYSFIASCKESNIEPLWWFNKILPQITDETPEEELMKLLPKQFIQK